MKITTEKELLALRDAYDMDAIRLLKCVLDEKRTEEFGIPAPTLRKLIAATYKKNPQKAVKKILPNWEPTPLDVYLKRNELKSVSTTQDGETIWETGDEKKD